MSLSVEGALITGIRTETTAYRCPLFARQVDVGGEGAVDGRVGLHSLCPFLQAVSGVDCVAAVVLYEITQILCRAALAAAVSPAADGAACQFQPFGGDTDGVGVAAACL